MFHHVFLWTVNLFKQTHKQTKRTSGCSWHTLVIHWMHLGSNRMFLMSWPFLGGIPTIDCSTKHSFNYFPKSNTICDTKTQWHQVLLRFCSVVHMAPDPTKNIVPLSTMFMHHAFTCWDNIRQAPVINWWYLKHLFCTFFSLELLQTCLKWFRM